jgi:hypothetical protein
MKFNFVAPIVLLLLVVDDIHAQKTTSVWLNTQPDIKYIGSDQCVACHEDQHASYLKTTHSVSMAKADPANEPEPGVFEHPRSGFRYEIERKDGKFIHREMMRDVDGNELAMTQQPMAYSVGSGTHGKSYLYKVGPFFGQSPLTWYQETKSWRMSPGFDKPYHSSFRRNIKTGCVFCHAGRIDRKQHNPYQFEIVDAAIGCERCHGPGELHAKKYRDNPDASGDDFTIVNPAKLGRDLGEAICQQCHLQGAGKATVSGKDQWDFRPGLPLTDFHVDYQYRLAGEKMRIVGHVDQMHASQCYQQTQKLTCTSCHDPHNPIPSEGKVKFYRSICQQCHEDQSCSKPHDQRVDLTGNSCYQCHMPKAETNVAHAALHHHRIGIHNQQDGEAQKAITQLAPVLDILTLSERERIRCGAIAKVGLIRAKSDREEVQMFGMEATEALIQLKNTGPLDSLSNSSLAWLAQMQGQQSIAESLANDVLKNEQRPTLPRIEATSMLARFAFQKGDKEQAVKLYREAVGHYRDSQDLFYLGLCENNLGNVKAAITALEQSLEIDPMQFSAHMALRAIYEATNQPEKAAVHEEAQLRNTALLKKLLKNEF